MAKVKISCETEAEKDKLIKVLSNVARVKKISTPVKSGKYYRVYLVIE